MRADFDPVDLVCAALERCPADPAKATAADLDLLKSAAQGLARHSTDLVRRVADLAEEIVTNPEGLSLREALERSEALDREYSRALVADRPLKTYLAAVISARRAHADARLTAGPTDHQEVTQ